MTKARTDVSDVSTRALDDLSDAVERLNQRVAVLTQAIDELHDEVQWRNNERHSRRDSAGSSFVLRSMPVDPTTDDWQLNRVSAQDVEALRDAVAPPAEPAAPPSPIVDAAASQTPDLR